MKKKCLSDHYLFLRYHFVNKIRLLQEEESMRSLKTKKLDLKDTTENLMHTLHILIFQRTGFTL